MPKHLNDQQERVLAVLDRIREQVRNDPEAAELYSEELDAVLQDLADDDLFGTEGQNDPRGDARDGRWTMWCVQGIDPAG